jgi:hypothetical protein
MEIATKIKWMQKYRAASLIIIELRLQRDAAIRRKEAAEKHLQEVLKELKQLKDDKAKNEGEREMEWKENKSVGVMVDMYDMCGHNQLPIGVEMIALKEIKSEKSTGKENEGDDKNNEFTDDVYNDKDMKGKIYQEMQEKEGEQDMKFDDIEDEEEKNERKSRLQKKKVRFAREKRECCLRCCVSKEEEPEKNEQQIAIQKKKVRFVNKKTICCLKKEVEVEVIGNEEEKNEEEKREEKQEKKRCCASMCCVSKDEDQEKKEKQIAIQKKKVRFVNKKTLCCKKEVVVQVIATEEEKNEEKKEEQRENKVRFARGKPGCCIM